MFVNGQSAHAHPARGFTLIELLIGVAIAVLLLLLAAPNYGVWIADQEIRAGAESVVTGLRFAFAEAIKRNQQIEFVLDPATGTGSWLAQPVGGPFIEKALHQEGAKLASFITTPAGATTVTFTGLGAINATNADTSAVLTQIDIASASGVSGSRPLRVLIGGGRTGIKLCDPAVTDTTSPRYCTT